MASMGVENRMAVVTGGESGIGAAYVSALAAAGADVAVCYLKDKAAAEKRCLIAQSFGRKAVAVKIPVGAEKDV